MKRFVHILLVLSLYGAWTSCSDSVSGNSIIDEPDSSKVSIDISNPHTWSLASVPCDPVLFPEATLKNDVASGKNRALLSWYHVDRLFTQRNSPDAPGYLSHDLDALSYPYAREVAVSEVFPQRPIIYGEPSTIQTLHLSFYPMERGPYNLDGTNVDEDGNLLYPDRRWGGIMRKIDPTDFEQEHIAYIQFWLLDPFMDDDLDNRDGGCLYFNLGEVSEDILKDGLMSYENGLPINGDITSITTSVWGRVSSLTPLVYSFDNNKGSQPLQDVGLDGLNNQAEFSHPTYARYLNELLTVLPAATIETMLSDPFSPFNDPAGDDYAYYLHSYYDSNRYSITERYKHYNNSEGNSLSQSEARDMQHQGSSTMPDVEDLNRDYSLNENERFFQYRVAIHPDSLQVGMNFITDKQEARVHTRNGETQLATWYQFTIPISCYQKRIGSIQDFSHISSIRLFMTGFKGTTHLRFATLELISGE